MDYQTGSVKPIGSIQEGWDLIKNDYWLFFAMVLVFGSLSLGLAFGLNFVVTANS